MNVSLTVNGEQVSHDVEPRQLLVHFLRETLDLTGTHWGCDTSNCGACVVLVDGEPVKSCTMLAPARTCASRNAAESSAMAPERSAHASGSHAARPASNGTRKSS